MTRRLYLFIGRILTPFALIGLRLYTLLTGRQRVRVLVTNELGEVLLLKGVISHQSWTVPGGGMNHHESAVAAARRELHEETGILAPESAFTYVKTLSRPEIAIPFKAPLFRVVVNKDQLPSKMANPYEIAAVEWFSRTNLPLRLSEIARYALKE